MKCNLGKERIAIKPRCIMYVRVYMNIISRLLMFSKAFLCFESCGFNVLYVLASGEQKNISVWFRVAMENILMLQFNSLYLCMLVHIYFSTFLVWQMCFN